MILFAAKFTSEKIGTSFSFFCFILDAKSFGMRAFKIYRGHLNRNWSIFIWFFKCHKHFSSILKTKLFCLVVFLQMLTAYQLIPVLCVPVDYYSFMLSLHIKMLIWYLLQEITFIKLKIYEVDFVGVFFFFVTPEIIASPNMTAVFL